MSEQLVEAGEGGGHVVGHPIPSGLVWVPIGAGARGMATLLLPPSPLMNYGRGTNQAEVLEAVLPEDFQLWPGPVAVDLRADPSMYWVEVPVGLRVETADGMCDVATRPLKSALRIPLLLATYPPRGIVTPDPGSVGEYDIEPLHPLGILFSELSGPSVLWADSAQDPRGWGTYAPGILAHRHSAVAHEPLMVVGQRVIGYRHLPALESVQSVTLRRRYHGVVANF